MPDAIDTRLHARYLRLRFRVVRVAQCQRPRANMHRAVVVFAREQRTL